MVDILTNMAEVKLSNRCKVCNLIKTDPELWEELHRLVFEKGYNKSRATRWLNGQLKARFSADANAESAEFVEFNHVNVNRHFNKHVSSLDKVKMELSKIANAEHGNDFTKEEQEKAEQIATDIQTPVISEYNIWKELLDFSLDAALSLKKDYLKKIKGQKRGLSHLEIDNYAECLTKIMSVKQHLVKLQSSEQALAIALTDLVNIVAGDLFARIQDTTLAIEGMLNAEFPNSSVADRSVDYIRQKFAEDVRVVLKNAMVKIKEQYAD